MRLQIDTDQPASNQVFMHPDQVKIYYREKESLPGPTLIAKNGDHDQIMIYLTTQQALQLIEELKLTPAC